MKNRIKISMLCICILLTALGCGSQSENEELSEERMESSEESVESAAATESDRKEQGEAHDYYEALIADARECIEGKVKESEDYDFSYMIYRYGAYYGASMGLGYLIEEYVQEIPEEIDGIMEIYDGGNILSVTEDMMAAQVVPEELLKGKPVLYDRFRVDGWIFEWLISDYADDNKWFWEDGVLVVSREGSSEDAQVISVKAEGGYATWVLAKNKFEYIDVNFDGLSDLLICTGHHGNQGLLTYYCFVQTKDGFEEIPSFTDIPNPSVDAEHKLILSQWRNSASSHSWAEYQYQNNTYVLYRELREYAESGNSDEDVWVWAVNGEVIGRSDKLSEKEIDDLIYNENSEWGISQDRWRTLYNGGLTTDFSIYGECP